MANRSVTVDADFGVINVSGGGSSGSRLTMTDGDVLTVTHLNLGANVTITTGTFSGQIWTSTANITTTKGTSATRTVKTGTIDSPTLNLTCSSPGYTSGTIYLNIISATDTLPDQWTFTDLTNVATSTYFYENMQVSGVSAACTAAISGGSHRKSPGDAWTTSNLTVNDGDTIYVRVQSSSSYSTAASATLKVGGNVNGTLNTDYRQDTFTVTTGVAPNTNTRISIGRSSGVAIDLDRVRRLVGPKNTSNQFGAAAMGNYFRGGTYCPDLTTGSPNNSGIPTSGTIDMADFYDSCTYIQFTSITGSKQASTQATSSGGTATVSFIGNTDWTLGYGPSMTSICDQRYRYDFVYNLDEGASQISLTLNGTDITSYLTSNYTTAWDEGFGNVEFSLSIGNLATYSLGGKLTIEARHPLDTSQTITAVTYFDLVVYSGA